MAQIKQTLPKDWRWVKLIDVCEITGGNSAPQGNEYFDGGKMPFVRMKDLGRYHFTNDLKETDDKLTESAIQKYRMKIFEPGCILFPRSGSVALNHRAILGVQACIVSHIGVLHKFSNTVDAQFLYYFLKTYDMTGLSKKTTGVDSIAFSDVAKIIIPLPPLDEQKRIASRLDEQMRHIEQARQAAEESLSAAWELPSKYLREVFDNDIANTGAKIRLGDILNLRKEVIHPYDSPKGPAVFVGLEHIEANSGIRVGSVRVEMSKLTGRKPKFYKGDIVYGYLRPYLNKVWIAEFDGLCSVDQYVYNIDDSKADIDFVAWFMRSPVYLERAPINTTPGQLPRIRTEEVASVLINLPLLEEQKRISLQISEQHNTVNKLMASLESQLAEINGLPSALLRQAFAGEL